MAEIDTLNDSMIGVRDGKVVSVIPLCLDTPEKAYRAAAWILAMAEATFEIDTIRSFEAVREAVLRS